MTFRGTNEDQSGQTSRGKIIALNYDAYNALPGDTCLYCLTDRQQMILLALLEFVGWPTRWYSPSNMTILRDTVEGYQADLAAALMSDVCDEIKTILDEIQDTVDDTKASVTDLVLDAAAKDVAIAAIATDLTTLSVAVGVGFGAVAGIAIQTTSILGTVNEMSDDVDNIETIVTEMSDDVDNIETIVTASATEITETGADVDNIELLTLKSGKNITNIYNQTTLININLAVPNSTYVADTSDNTSTATFARYNAFCTAIVQWMYAEIYALMTALSAPPTDLATLALQLNTTANSLWSLANTGSSYGVADIYAAISDTSAVNDVACAMITKLATLKPSYETFATALSTYAPPAYPDHRNILKDALGQSLLYLDSYTLFAGLYQDIYYTTLAAAPTTYVCAPCGTINPGCGYQTWDFTIGQKSPWTFNRGIYVPGQGLVGVQVPGDAGYGFVANLVFPSGCKPTATTYIHFTLLGLPQNTNNSFYFETYAIVAGVETLQEWVFYISEATYPTPITTSKEWTFGPLVNYKLLSRIRIVSNTYYNTPSGGNWITPTYSALQKVVFNATP